MRFLCFCFCFFFFSSDDMDDLAPVAQTIIRKSSFFACYLLCSQKPRCGRTYIGFTVNPRRRIRQHNGEITSGAFRTKKWRPWEMILCIYGFPSQVHALQFEWAWQHPHKSLVVREAIAGIKALGGKQGKVMVMYKMLNIPKWNKLDLIVNFLSTKHLPLAKKCPCLPPQMQVKVGPLEDLPCYLDLDDSDGDNIDDVNNDDGDNDNGNNDDGSTNDELDGLNKQSEDALSCTSPTVTTNIETLWQLGQEPPWMDHDGYRKSVDAISVEDLSHPLAFKSSFGCTNPIETADIHCNQFVSVDSDESTMSEKTPMSRSGAKVLVNLVSPESRCKHIGSHRDDLKSHRQHEMEADKLDMQSDWKPIKGGHDTTTDLSSTTPIAHPHNEDTRSLLNISQFSPLWSPSPCQKPGGMIDLSQCVPNNIFNTPEPDSSASRSHLEEGYLLSHFQGKQSEIIDLTSSPVVP